MNDSGEDKESDVVRLKLLLLLRMHIDRRFGCMDEDSLSLFLAPVVVVGAVAVREKSKSPSTFSFRLAVEEVVCGFLDIADGDVIGLFINCSRMRFIVSVALWVREGRVLNQS